MDRKRAKEILAQQRPKSISRADAFSILEQKRRREEEQREMMRVLREENEKQERQRERGIVALAYGGELKSDPRPAAGYIPTLEDLSIERYGFGSQQPTYTPAATRGNGPRVRGAGAMIEENQRYEAKQSETPSWAQKAATPYMRVVPTEAAARLNDPAEKYMRSISDSAVTSWYLKHADETTKQDFRTVLEQSPDRAAAYVKNNLKPKQEQYDAEELRKKQLQAIETVRDIESDEGISRWIKEGWTAFTGGLSTILGDTTESGLANSLNMSRREQAGKGNAGLKIITAIGGMAPSMIPGLGAAGAAVTVGATSAIRSFREALADGASNIEAGIYGMLVGGLEASLSKALSGISAFAGKSNLATKIGNAIPKAFAKVPRNVITKPFVWTATKTAKSFPELIEESLQSFADPALASLVYDKEVDWSSIPEQMLEEGLLGWATAAVLNLAYTPAARGARTRELTRADIDIALPKPLAQAISAVESGGSVSDRLANKISVDLGARAALSALQPMKDLGITQGTLDTIRKAVGMQSDGVLRATNVNTEVAKVSSAAEEIAAPVVSDAAQPVIDALLANKPISGNQANKVLDDVDALRYAEELLGVDTSTEKTISGKRSILVKAAQSNADVQAKILTQSESENWRTTAVKENQGKNKPPVYSLSQLLDAFSKVFDVNVRVGNLGSKNTLGEHNRRTGSVKIKTTNDLPTTAHEIGHALDRISGITKNAPKNVTEELKANLSDKMKELYKPNKYVTEGMAEYAREFILNYENAAAKYPETTAYLQSTLPAKTLERLQFIARHTNRYFSSTTAERLHATNHPTENIFKLPMDVRVSNFVESKKDAAIIKYTDDLYGIVKAANNTENKQQAQNLYDAYVEAQVARQMDEKLIQDAIYGDGVKDFDGNVLAPSLVQSLQPVYDGLKQGEKKQDVQSRVKDLEDYLNAVDAIDRLQPPGKSEAKTAYGDRLLNDAATLREEVERMEKLHPEFKDAAQNIYTFSRALLWLEYQAGIITEETFNKLIREHPHYVPFYRDMGETDSKKVSGGNKPLVQKATGSARDFLGTIEGLALNASKAIKDSHQNTIAKKICRTINSQPEMAWLLEKNNKQTTVEKYDSNVIFSEVVERAGENADKNVIDYIESLLQNDIIKYGADVLKGDRDVVVFENGEPVSYHVNDAALYTALTSLDLSGGDNSYVLKTVADANKMFTSVVTSENIIWNISSNMPRDFITMLAQSDTTKDMFMNLAHWMKYFAMSATGTRKKGLYAQEFFELMGGQASQIGAEVKSLGRRKTDSVVNTLAYQNKTLTGKAWHKIKHPFATTKNSVLSIAEAVELIPRLAAYETARKNGKSKMDALFDSMEITTNFTRHGSVTRKVNRYIPFLNASVQGLSKGGRQLTGVNYKGESRRRTAFRHATKYIALSATLSILSLISRFFASDEEEFDEKYSNLTEYQKNNAYNIYLGNDKWLSIKKPREIGILSSLMERGWEKFFMDGEDVLKDFAGYSAEQLLPPVLDALPALLVGLWPGNDFGEAFQTAAAQAVTSLGPFGNIAATAFNVDYRGNPIIPSYLNDNKIPNKDRFGDQTTETAKLIGAALDISPLQVDSFLSNLGIIQTINKEFFTRSGDKNFLGHLGSLFGGGLVKDGLYSQKIVTEFYDGRKTVQTAANANKDDIGYQIDAKEYDTMAAFYSAFNNLQKQEKDQTSDLFRENRGTVLDMLSQFSYEMENGIEAPWLTALHDLTYDAVAYNENEAKNSWEEIDTMGFYPQQLGTEFRYKPALYEKQLTSAEYLWYQTNYLANYKVLVTEALEETNGSVKQRVKAVQRAKSEAKDMTDKALYQYLTGGK